MVINIENINHTEAYNLFCWKKGLKLNGILSNPSFSCNLWLNLLILDLVMVYSFDKSVLTSLFPQGLTHRMEFVFLPLIEKHTTDCLVYKFE